MLYAIATATIIGIGFPVYWMVFRQKRPISDLGITKKNLLISLVLQVIFAAVILPGGFKDLTVPPFEQLAPLICLTLAATGVWFGGWVDDLIQRLTDLVLLFHCVVLLWRKFSIHVCWMIDRSTSSSQ